MGLSPSVRPSVNRFFENLLNVSLIATLSLVGLLFHVLAKFNNEQKDKKGKDENGKIRTERYKKF